MDRVVPLGCLVGLVLDSVEMVEGEDGLVYEVQFTSRCGRRFALCHDQECCEVVILEDVIGDVSELVGSPIVVAYEESSKNSDPIPDVEDLYTWTWTFYRLGTVNGTVTFRWLGESNGYYSEAVEFFEC